MNKFLYELFMRLVLILSVISILGCNNSNLTGTSTTTGNTISGIVLDESGTPAEGATVSLRSSNHISDQVSLGLFKHAVPVDTMVVTNDKGEYSFNVLEPDTLLLEIMHNGKVAWIKDIISNGKKGVVLAQEDKKVEVPSSVIGSIDLQGIEGSLWVTVPGTENVVRVDQTGSYSLQDLPKGTHDIQIILITMVNGEEVRSVYFLNDIVIDYATSLILDRIESLPNNGNFYLPVNTCPDNVNNILADNIGIPHKGRPPHLLRTILNSNPSQLLEIDLCIGVSRVKRQFTEKINVTHIISSDTSDYLFNVQSRAVFVLDTSTASDGKKDSIINDSYPQNFDLMDASRNDFITYDNATKQLSVFNSINDLLLNNTAFHLSPNLPGTENLGNLVQISLHSSRLFALAEDNNLHLLAIPGKGATTLEPIKPPVPLTFLANQTVTGLKAISPSNVFILTTSGNLYLFDLDKNDLIKHLSIEISGDFVGLSQF